MYEVVSTAVRDMMRRLRERLPHQTGRANCKIEPGVVVHLDARTNAVPGLTDQMGDGAAEFYFGRRVGFVAALVLEPLNLEAIARPVGEPARRDEAG